MPTTTLIALVFSCVAAFFLSAVPSGYIVAKRMGNVDVRTTGSGNIGTTNVARSVGARAAALTLCLDVLKAFISLVVAHALIGLLSLGSFFAAAPGQDLDWTLALVYLFVIAGHMFSPYLHFHGGKGIAVGLGGALGFMPLVGVSLLVPFLVFAFLTRRVSVGSIGAALSLPFLAWAIYRPGIAFLCILAVVALLVVFAHRSNIVKLARGQERPFSFKKKGGSR